MKENEETIEDQEENRIIPDYRNQEGTDFQEAGNRPHQIPQKIEDFIYKAFPSLSKNLHAWQSGPILGMVTFRRSCLA